MGRCQATCREAIDVFEEEFAAKYPKAIACICKDKEELMTIYEFPAQQWTHLRTTNPIESTFATVRLRQRVTRGAGSRRKALLMAFKLIETASKRWRPLKGYKLMSDLANGCRFANGIGQNNSEENAGNSKNVAA